MAQVIWIKLVVNMFDDEKIKIIETMPQRDMITVMWLKLLCQAGKVNSEGNIYLTREIPYTEAMLAAIFNRSIEELKFSMKVLADLGMIKVREDNIIEITNWNKHQNVEGMEKVREQTRKRVARCREKKGKLMDNSMEECNVTVTQQKERDKEDTRYINISSKKEREEFIHSQSLEIVNHYDKVLGTIGMLNIAAVKLAVEIHGVKYVRLAIDKAIERNKVNMTYVNGILSNWAKEGYPKGDDVGNGNVGRESGGEKFKGFRASKPDVATEEECRRAQENLI